MDRFPSCCKSVNLENMVISDSNPMQNLRKSMQKVQKKKKKSFLERLLMKLSMKLNILQGGQNISAILFCFVPGR